MKKLTPFLLLLLSASIVAQQPEPVSVKTVVAVAEDKDKEPTVADTIKPSVEEKETLTVPKKVEKVSSMTSRLGINAGQTRTLTLNQAIRLALSNNNTIAIGRDDVRIAESQLRSLEGFYDPSFTVNPSYDRNQTNGQSATNDLRFNSSFNGQVKNGGGDYSIFFNNTRTENAFAQSQATAGNFSGNSSSALYFSTLGVRFSQPLLRDFAVDSTRRQIKIQKKRVAQSDADFRRQSIEVISQVQRAYWDLVFALRDQQNRVANLNLTKENLRQVEARIKAGAAAPLQRAEVNTELANRESDLLVATQQVSIAENALKQLLLKDAGASEWSESLVPTDKPVFSSEPVNLQNALKDAVANRPELSRLRLEKEINEIDRKFFSNQTKPRLDLTSTFSLNGIGQSGADSTTSLQFPLISGDPNSNANAFLLQELQRLSPTTIDVPNVLLPPTPTFLTGGLLAGV